MKKRTFWPIGIVLIIALGIGLIIISVRISMQQSIDTDKTFGLERIEVDTNINAIMAYQNQFEKYYIAYIGINTMNFTENNKIANPYYITAVPKDYPPEQERLKENNNIIYLAIKHKKHKTSYLDSGDSTFLNSQVVLELTRLGKDDKKVTILEFPMTIAQKNDNEMVIYQTESFSLPLTGYYQARFRIKNINSNSDKSIQETEKIPEIFFYHWIFNRNP